MATGFRGAIFDVDGVLVDSPHERAWREHPEHRAAQKRGREEFYSSYDIARCVLVDEWSFTT